MDICLFGTSALEALRSPVLARGGLAGFARTSATAGLGVPRLRELNEELASLGIRLDCAHVLVASDSVSHGRRGVTRHVCRAPLPCGSLVRLTSRLLVPVPALCFVQLADPSFEGRSLVHGGATSAASPSSARLVRMAELVAVGFEFAGTYRVDPASPDGFVNIPRAATSAEAFGRYIGSLERVRGLPLARRAAALVQDGSHSCGETSMAPMLCAPRSLGGVGLPRGELNRRVATAAGACYVDLAWAASKVGAEYKGRRHHLAGHVSQDDRRGNKLAGRGFRIVNVWHEDLARPRLFDELVADIARALGVRVRIRDDGFRFRQNLLRAAVLPPLRRYDDLA